MLWIIAIKVSHYPNQHFFEVYEEIDRAKKKDLTSVRPEYFSSQSEKNVSKGAMILRYAPFDTFSFAKASENTQGERK